MDAATSTTVERPHISWETYSFMRQEISRLQAENAQLRSEVEHWEQQTNHWYMKANYSDFEIAMFIRRRSLSQDQRTGEWLTAKQQDAA